MSYDPQDQQKEVEVAVKTVVNTYDLCPCGSGKKYKWCCMSSDKAKKLEAKTYGNKSPSSLNRKQRRTIESMRMKAQKIENKKTQDRNKFYLKLKSWLASSDLPEELSSQVFKDVLKKLFKRTPKNDVEFYNIIRKSQNNTVSKSLINTTIQQETTDEN